MRTNPCAEVPTPAGNPSNEFYRRVRGLRDEIGYKSDYDLVVGVGPEGRVFIQVKSWRKDAVTGKMSWGPGGKFFLSEFMTDQEIVQRAFGLFKDFEIHECREFFTYKGKRIYGPHISLEALMEIADRTTYRD